LRKFGGRRTASSTGHDQLEGRPIHIDPEKQPICKLPGLEPDANVRWRSSQIGSITECLERELILGLIGKVRDQGILDGGWGMGDAAMAISPSAPQGAVTTSPPA
jgi:hypothetical protein